MKALLDGMLTGLFLQLALGPVFFYILGITIDSNYINSLSAVLAVTLADYIYIVLSLIGIGKLLRKEKMKAVFGFTGPSVLLIFGMMILYRGVMFGNASGQTSAMEWTPITSFTSCFILTISSPMTIIFWSSIFSAKAIERDYKKNQLVVFGIGTGAATFLFLSLSMLILSLLKTSIPEAAVRVMNGIVGLLLICYGITRIMKPVLKNRKKIHSRLPE